MKKIGGLLLSMMLAMSLMTGCSQSAPQTTAATAAPAAPAATQAAAAPATQAAAPVAQEEKILIEGRASDSITLDPFNATDNASWRVARQIYDTLVGFESGTFAPKPGLATEWEISEDGLTYTFTLREGVKFHDGTDFNADAVVFNIERWWDENNEYHDGEFGNVVSFFGGFKGDEKCIISDVKALDGTHVEITLSQVYPAFLARLTDPSTAIISPEAIKAQRDAIGQNPVGTGPFMFESWAPNDNITLTKNPDYWDGAPAIDKLIFKVIPDNTARLTALQSGEIDIMDSLNPSDFPVVDQDPALQVIERPAINCGFFWINTTKAPFDNVKVRQALNMAINKEGIISSLYNGLAIPAKSVLSPSSWAYNPDMQDYAFDAAAAKSLLAEAGYPDGFDMKITVRSEARAYFPQPLKLAEIMQANLKDIGITASVETADGSTYSGMVYGGDYDIAAWGTGGNDPDPALAINHYFNKATASGERAQNSARWENDEATDLLNTAQSILDQEERAGMYREVQQIVHDEAIIIPIVHVKAMLAAAQYVQGYTAFTDYYESYAKVDLQ